MNDGNNDTTNSSTGQTITLENKYRLIIDHNFVKYSRWKCSESSNFMFQIFQLLIYFGNFRIVPISKSIDVFRLCNLLCLRFYSNRLCTIIELYLYFIHNHLKKSPMYKDIFLDPVDLTAIL